MIRVRMRIDEKADAQPCVRSQSQITVYLALGSIKAATRVSGQPTRYDWQPPLATCSKITGA